ncbi:hypothetical protein, partial [Thioclava sp. F34-6]|uniref:hypothetical protein n=1 Tax=Thioclava sp. F34-6 TaxID=1973003 RepID=UPI001F0B423A
LGEDIEDSLPLFVQTFTDRLLLLFSEVFGQFHQCQEERFGILAFVVVAVDQLLETVTENGFRARWFEPANSLRQAYIGSTDTCSPTRASVTDAEPIPRATIAASDERSHELSRTKDKANRTNGFEFV